MGRIKPDTSQLSNRSTPTGRAKRDVTTTPATVKVEKPPKARYVPGGPGGGGRYVYEDGSEAPVGGTGPGGYNYTGPRGRIGPANAAAAGITPIEAASNARRNPTSSRRSAPKTSPSASRSRPTTTHSSRPRRSLATARDNLMANSNPFDKSSGTEPWGGTSNSAIAREVTRAEEQKPREEKEYPEFHPHLDVNAQLVCYSAEQIDGTEVTPERPVTPPESTVNNHVNEAQTPSGHTNSHANGGDPVAGGSVNGDTNASTTGTPITNRRASGRVKKPVDSAIPTRALLTRSTSALRIIPLEINHAKDKLKLMRPSFKEVDPFEQFENKESGQQEFVDRAMAHAGYQESELYERPETLYRHNADSFEVDIDKCEYDMDQQDVTWLDKINESRAASGSNKISKWVFETTITKLEKEYHLLERRIPKPNPRPPQTHRPRSSSAAAVNGEPQAGEEQDSKCNLCDDGDCENTNAIVFCDGCDLAVHQDCYGVPFIPEGQWLCRKCLNAGSGVPTCLLCPNSDGAFKQTTDNRWAHLHCSLWVPDVNVGNFVYMEPIQDVHKISPARKKLKCYICLQKMGAPIQCSKSGCYVAFHAGCGKKAQLSMKMKNSHGQLIAVDPDGKMLAFCDKHCSEEHKKEFRTDEAFLAAKRFYKKKFKHVIWAKDKEEAIALAGQSMPPPDHPEPSAESLDPSNSRQQGSAPSKQWKLPSGAPLIPHVIFQTVDNWLMSRGIHKRKEYLEYITKYWTLKREQRRGAPLIKRMQLLNESFSTMDITRRDFAGMGAIGKVRLDSRIDFAAKLENELKQLLELTQLSLDRSKAELEANHTEAEMMDAMYFPLQRPMLAVYNRALSLDSKDELLAKALTPVWEKLNMRYWVSALLFAQAYGAALSNLLAEAQTAEQLSTPLMGVQKISPTKKATNVFKDRKAFVKRVISKTRDLLTVAVDAQADIEQKPREDFREQLKKILDAAETPIKLQVFEPDDADLMDTAVDDGDAHQVPDEAGISPSKLTNGASIKSDQGALHPPTPPISNGENSSNVQEGSDASSLERGGVVWYAKDFKPDGTNATIPEGADQPDVNSDALSDVDEETFNGMDIDVEDGAVEEDAAASASPKKAKAKVTRKKRKSARRSRR